MRDDQPEQKCCGECRDLYMCDDKTRLDCVEHGYKHFKPYPVKMCASCGGDTKIIYSRPDKYGDTRRKRVCRICGEDFKTEEKRVPNILY